MTPPTFFVLDGVSFANLPVGAEFVCVQAPEATIGVGWRLSTFRVVVTPGLHATPGREYQAVGSMPLREDEAAALWERESEP